MYIIDSIIYRLIKIIGKVCIYVILFIFMFVIKRGNKIKVYEINYFKQLIILTISSLCSYLILAKVIMNLLVSIPYR